MSHRSRAKRRAGAAAPLPPPALGATLGKPAHLARHGSGAPALRAAGGEVQPGSSGHLGPATRRDSLALGVVWFGLVFSLLCAAGALAGELAHQWPGPWVASAGLALAVLTGLLLGRAVPAHPLVRRLDVALLLLALLLAATCGLTLWLEAVRSGLVRRSTLPAGVLRAVLVAPAWILTAFSAAWGRAVLRDTWCTARDALTPPRFVALTAVAVAAASTTAWASRVSDLIAAPGAAFAAALLVTLFRLERSQHAAASAPRFPRTSARVALFGTIAAALALTVAIRPARNHAAPLTHNAQDDVRLLLAARAPRCVAYTNPHAVTADAVWELDLDGPTRDVIILTPQSAPGELRRADARRLLRRLAAALVRGGRLIVENPQPSQIEAAFWIQRHDLTWPQTVVAAVVVPAMPQSYEALVLGPDMSLWLAQQAESPPAATSGSASVGAISESVARMRYVPARGPRHFEALRAAARQ